jgi:hypothetical protein
MSGKPNTPLLNNRKNGNKGNKSPLTSKNLVPTTVEGKKVQEMKREMIEMEKKLNFLFDENKELLGLDTLSKMAQVVQDNTTLLQKLPPEKEKAFIIEELKNALIQMNILLPDINTTDSKSPLLDLVKYVSMMLAERIKANMSPEEYASFNNNNALFNETGKRVPQSKGTIELLNQGGGVRDRAGSQGPPRLRVTDPRFAGYEAAAVAGVNAGTSLQEALYRRDAALFAAQQGANAAAFAATAAAFEQKAKSSFSVIKLLVFFLLGMTVLWLGATLGGDAVHAWGVTGAFAIRNMFVNIGQRLWWVSTFGDIPSGATVIAPLSLRNAFQGTIPLSDELATRETEDARGILEALNTAVIPRLQGKKSAQDAEHAANLEALNAEPCISRVGPLLTTVKANQTRLQGLQSRFGGVGIGGLQLFSYSEEDMAYMWASGNRTALETLQGFLQEGDYYGFVLAPELSTVPSLAAACPSVNVDAIQTALAQYEAAVTPTNVKAILDALQNQARGLTTGDTPVAAFDTFVSSNGRTVVAPSPAPRLANAPRGTVAAPSPVPLLTNAPRDPTTGAVITTNASGVPTVTLSTPELRGAFANENENESNAITATGFNSLEQHIFNHYKGLISQRLMNELLERSGKRAGGLARLLGQGYADGLSAATGYYYDLASAIARRVIANCRGNPGGICGNISPEQEAKLLRGIKLLILQSDRNLPPSADVLSDVIQRILSDPEGHPYMTRSDFENEDLRDFYLNNPSIEVRALFSLAIGALLLTLYEGSKRVVKVPLDLFEIVELIVKIPKEGLLRVYEFVKGKPKAPAEAIREAAAAVEAAEAADRLLARSRRLPLPEPRGVARGRSRSVGRRRLPGAPTGALLNASAASAARGNGGLGSALVPSRLGREAASNASAPSVVAAVPSRPRLGNTSGLRMAPPLPNNRPLGNNNDPDRAAELLLGLARGPGGRGGRRIHRRKTSKKRHMKKRKGTRRH